MSSFGVPVDRIPESKGIDGEFNHGCTITVDLNRFLAAIDQQKAKHAHQNPPPDSGDD